MASSSDRAVFRTIAFALCAVRHPETGKWLCVNEKRDRGWWIAGGGVDMGETFQEAAIREVYEETLINVELVGVLKVEHEAAGTMARMRVIFLGKPVDPAQPPKAEPDAESKGAAWLTVAEMRALGEKRQLRGREPLEWAEFIEEGGTAAPLSILGGETGLKRPVAEPQTVTVSTGTPAGETEAPAAAASS